MNLTKAQLTVIIPFLNEKEEVENTVKSIRENSTSDDVTILLINDASDDGFDYEQIAETYNTAYVLNEKRMGVASSRDLGVLRSSTPYIILLDAHMRFYNSLWVDRIVNELKEDSRVLLCCQTRGLMVIDNDVIEIRNRPVSLGAYIDFLGERTFLECFWIFNESEILSGERTIYIPSVLGAAYSFSREYWLYLKGLEGLKYYGNDEPFISMKVWLEGGACKLLKDVAVGHIYRDLPPYQVENVFWLYNRLLIAELLLPDTYKARIYSRAKDFLNYKEALSMIYQNREDICSKKSYFTRIFKYDFSYFQKFNDQFNRQCYAGNNVPDLLEKIANHLVLKVNASSTNGLVHGKFGIVIFLFHYSSYSANDTYRKFAEIVLENIVEDVHMNSPQGFCEGLIGIGWGIEYLYQNGFVQGNTNEVLNEFDELVLQVDLDHLNDLNLDNGLGGILHYVLTRLYTIEKENKENPFNSNYLANLYTISKKALQGNYDIDSLYIIIRYCLYFEKKTTIQQPSVYDVVSLKFPIGYQYKNFVLGLEGNAGVGINLILGN